MNAETALRTFLFADLRDYTAFVEGQGDRAAADLIRTYREVIRAGIAAHEGAEIKTEGDSFYVTFPFPSRAIDFGVDVLRSAQERDRRLRFGIGVHTGETVPLEGQFVGSAVNLAARVGAVAGEGELLVTDTVRGLVRTSSPYRLLDRGEFSLKGVSERIRLHAVEWRQVDAAPPVAGLPTEASPSVEPFVGREQELDDLRRASAALREGRGGLVMIGAPAGMGKTRLVSEWTADLQVTALIGTCGATDARSPYEPFLEMLRRLTRVPSEEERLRRLAPELAGLLPELGTDRPRHIDRDALFGAFLHLVREYARARPLALVVDDLHWADDASLALFRFLATQAATTPFLLVGTYRDDELVRGHPVRSLLADLGRRTDVRTVTLRALGQQGAEALLAHVHGAALAPEQQRRIVALAEGNPLFLEELARSSDDPTKALPLTIAEAVLRRVADLDAPTRQLITYAAVSGMQVGFDLLRQLLRVDERDVLRAARAGVDRSIFVETADGLAFRHALMREAVYRDLMRREQRLYHEEVAEALVATRGTDGTAADEIERHFLDAGRPDRALPYALTAGEYALHVLAPAEAIVHFERAVDAAPPRSVERARALEGLGNAYRLALQVGKAVATLRDAAVIFRDIGTPADRLRAQRALASALPFGAEERKAWEEAWTLAQGIAPAGELAVIANTLASRAYQFMDEAATKTWLSAARELAMSAGAPALEASIERTARGIEHSRGWHIADERDQARQLDRALERNDGVLLAYRRYLDARCRDARAEEREALLARARSYAEEHAPGIPRSIVFQYGPPWMSWCDGDWDGVIALWRELQQRFAGEDLAEIFPDTGPIAAAVRLEREGPDITGPTLTSLAQRQARTSTWRGRLAAAAHLGNLHLARGDVAAIRDQLCSLLQQRSPQGLDVPMLLLVARVVLPAALIGRDRTLVEPWLAAAPLLEGEGTVFDAVTAHAEAARAAIAGDSGAATRSYERAAASYRDRGWDHLAAELAWQQASAGDPSELPAARAFYEARGAGWRLRWLEVERWR